MKRQKKNSSAYLILIVVHISLLIFTFFKQKNRKKLFIQLLSLTGFAYFFEYIVINIFKAYRYKPRLLNKPYFDHLLGAILSQGVFVPFTSLFLSAFKLGWKGKLFFSLYFTIVEWIFVKINIYKHKWWRTMYTPVLLNLFFVIGDFWYRAFFQGNKLIMFLSLFISIAVTNVNFLYVLASTQKLKFGTGKVRTWREHFRIAPIYSITISLITALFIKSGIKCSIALNLLSIITIDLLLKKIGFVRLSLRNVFVHVFIQLFMIYVSLIYKKMIYDEKDIGTH